MDEPRAAADRRLFGIAGALIGVVMVATLTVVALLVLVRRDAAPAPVVAPAATPAAEGTPAAGASLLRAIELRSGPASDVAIITRLAAGTRLRVLGRSQDGQWLVVAPEARPEQVGWVPAAVVGGLDVSALAVVSPEGGSPARPATAVPTLTPDLPDLRVARSFARGNVLHVEVVNDGAGDALGAILVSVNDAEPLPLDVKPGEALRAGESVEAAIRGVYVQLRAPVHVQVILEGGAEEDVDNNEWSGIVAPDLPNDLEVRSVTTAADGHVVVTIVNNSPIPVSGAVTVSIREALPGTTLIARETRSMTIAAGGVIDFAFPDVRGVDLTRVTIRLSSDAIEDAVIANNSYPR
jgi:hypothetical protein